MAKKSKKKFKPPKRQNVSEIEFLEILLKGSLDAITGQFEEIDSVFRNQAERLQAKIDKLKENQ